MTDTQNFSAQHYGARAQDYVASAVHAGGADLDQIEAFLRGTRTGRVLDLGCGGGHVSYRAAPLVDAVVACDVTPAMLEAVKSTAAARSLTNITVQQAAAEHLPFPDASFDLVLCRFTTHHWRDWETGLREARRVLRPGAPALFIDIVADADPLFDTHLQAVELLRDVSHVRDYTAAEWMAALSRARFSTVGLTLRTLRMEFDSWSQRTQTPPVFKEAIRALQRSAPDAVHQHFGIAADGSFDIQSATFELRAV